eukprot:3958634-Ditylum_brightwellii.AAC.1
MELGNLGKEDVNWAVMLMSCVDDASRTHRLTNIYYRKTLGNSSFLLDFIELLKEEGLLYFHLGLFQWKWDEVEIKYRTAPTENPVDLLQQKMERLSVEAQ